MKNSNRLNVGYILVLKKNDGNILSVDKVDVPRPTKILKDLDAFENDKEYDIFTVQKYVSKLNLNRQEQYDYCWPYEYNNSYIQPAMVPINITKEDYDKELQAIKNHVRKEYEEKCHFGNFKGNYRSYIAGLKKEMQDEILKKQKAYARDIRNRYVAEIRRYLYAKCFFQVVPTVRANSLMFSNEAIGWYEPDFQIADGILISVRTNFCYGSSAYFYVNLNYKGINILPYSDIVTYFWSNMMDSVRYTRDYYPFRSNWKYVLSFVKEVSNMITIDRKRFEKEWIMDELANMMEGLKTINDEIDKYYEMQKKMQEQWKKKIIYGRAETICKYRNIDNHTIKRYNIYKRETLFTIQVDKLSAALSLLEELIVIKNIYSPVLKYMETIVLYNEKLISAIDNCHVEIAEKVTGLKEQIIRLRERQDDIQTRIHEIKMKISEFLEVNYQGYQKISKENKDDILIKECKKNEEYEEAVVALDSVTIEILRKQNEIQDREFFDQHLMERRGYIVKKIKEIRAIQ